MRVGVVWPDPVGDEGVDAALEAVRVAVSRAIADHGHTVRPAEMEDSPWEYDILIVLSRNKAAQDWAMSRCNYGVTVVADTTMSRTIRMLAPGAASSPTLTAAIDQYHHRHLLWLEARLRHLAALTEAKP